MSNIRKTYAEVMEEVANISWAIMDAEQHAVVASKLQKRIGDVTSDGVALTWALFGRALGTTAAALQAAAQRAKSGSSSTKPDAVAIRRVKSDFAKVPANVKRELVKSALMDDPDVFGDQEVRHAAALAVSANMKPRTTPATKQFGLNTVSNAILAGIEFRTKLEAAVRKGLSNEEQAEVDQLVASILDVYKGVSV